MVQVAVTLSDWLYRAVLSQSVLTLGRDYFRLRKPLERRVYELARKHCGRQAEWRVGMATLAKKSGSASPLRVFRRMIRDMVAERRRAPRESDLVRLLLDAEGDEVLTEDELTAMFVVPGGGDMMIYQPRHPSAYDLA